MSTTFNPLSGNFETKEPGPQGPAGTVSAAGDGSEGTPSISFASETNTGLYKYAGESIAISTGGTGRLFVNASGNLGVGTTLLSFAEGSGLRVERSDIATVRLQRTGSHGFEISAQSDKAKFRSVNDKPFVFANGSNSELLYLTSNGRLGLGTTDPSHKLDIVGNSNQIVTSRVSNPDVGVRLSAYTNQHAEIRVETNHPLVFKTNGNNERLRIDNSGAASFKGGTVLVEATSNTANAQLSLGRPNSTSAGYIRYINTDNAMAFRTNGSGEDMRLSSVGHLGIGVTNPQARLEIGGTETAGVPAIDVSTYAADVTDTSDIVLSPNGVIRAQDSINNVVNSGGFYTWNIGGTDDKAGKAGSSERLRLDSSGNLKLGGSTISTSPNINLKADGQGEFAAGNVVLKSGFGYSSVEVKNTAQRYSLGTDGATNNLRVYNGTTSTTFSSWRTNGDFYHGGGSANGTDISSPNIRLNADGSALFAGSLDLTDSTIDLYSQTTNAASRTFQVFSDIGGTKTEKAAILANGSASFMGRIGLNRPASDEAWTAVTIPSGNTSDIGYFVKPSSNGDYASYKAFVASSGGSEKVQIYNTGQVYASGYTNGSGNVALGAQITSTQTTGLLIASTSSSLNGNTAIEVKNSSGTSTVDINADGSATFAGSVSIGGTAAANTIDEYEEGTWTPAFIGTSTAGTPTYASSGQAGKYTRVGNQVTAWAYLDVTNLGGAAGNINITGLPFPVDNTGFGSAGVSVGHADGTLGNGVRAYHNTSFLELRNNNSVVTAATGQIYVAITYRT